MANRKRNLNIAKRRKQRASVVSYESNIPKKYTEEEIDFIAHSIAWVGMIVFMFLAMGLAMLIV